MNKNSRVHSGSKGKHQFGKEDKSKLKKGICDIIEKNGTQKGVEIIVDILGGIEDKQRKRKLVFIIVLICVVGGILLTCLFELIGRKLNLNDMLRKILQFAPVFVENIFIIIIAIFKIVGMPKNTRLRKDGESYAEGMLEWVKDLWHQLSRASGLHVLILLMVTTLVATLIAQREPMKHIKAFFSGGMYAMAHCDDNNNITDSVMPADGKEGETSVSNKYLVGAYEVMIRRLDKGEVTNEQRDMVLQLSDEDVYSIFICWENGSDGYGTQEQLNDTVLSTVQGWCGENRDNVFDRVPEQGGAPQKVKDAISQASESEQPDDSFSDIEDRLDLRESVAKDYPKRTLMQLIANGYQDLALKLDSYGGVQSTIIYYYGQSILFDFECLKFADNTDRTIKKRLTIIAQRYEDIAYVCPDYERAGEARRLAAAFRYAADQY